MSQINLDYKQICFITDKHLDLNSFFILEMCYDGVPLEEFRGNMRMRWAIDVTEKLGYVDKGVITDIGKGVIESIRGQQFDWDMFVDQFRETFPARKLGTGKNFKSNLVDISKRLKKFVKEYKYSYEKILEAARQYVIHAEQKDFQYIRTAAYFIYKQNEGSELADWCEKVGTEEVQSKEPVQTFI